MFLLQTLRLVIVSLSLIMIPTDKESCIVISGTKTIKIDGFSCETLYDIQHRKPFPVRYL